MDGQHCDRHPSAWAKARITLPSLRTLYFCGHCARTLNFGDDYHIQYQVVRTKS